MKKNIEKIIEYGIYLLAFLLPWQTRWIARAGSLNGGYSEYLTYSLYASDIILAALLVLYFAFDFPNKRFGNKKKMHWLWLSIGLLDLAAFVSVFKAPNHALALYKYANLLLAVGLFAMLVNFPYKMKKLLYSFFLALFIESGIGIYQFLRQDSLASKWLGMARHIPHEAGVSAVEAMGNLGIGERWMRSYGSLPHPNILGGFVAFGIVLMLVSFLYVKRKDYGKSDHDSMLSALKENIAYHAVILVSLLALFFSFSRSAWLAVFLSVALILFVSVLKRDLVSQKLMLSIVLYSMVMLFVVSYPFSNLIEARTMSKGRIERISVDERESSLSLAKDVLRRNWLLGVGLGNYTEKVERDFVKGQESYYYQPVHNAFLLVFSELGILGLAAFLALLCAAFFLYEQASSLAYRLPLFATLSLLLFFDHWLWSLHFGLLFFWFVLGVAVRFFGIYDEGANMV